MTSEEKLLKIIRHYGVLPQLKYFQSEVFELNEAIIREEEDWEIRKNNVAQEIADCYTMLEQFRLHYEIDDREIKSIMKYKIDRQLDRIDKEVKNEIENK